MWGFRSRDSFPLTLRSFGSADNCYRSPAFNEAVDFQASMLVHILPYTRKAHRTREGLSVRIPSTQATSNAVDRRE